MMQGDPRMMQQQPMPMQMPMMPMPIPGRDVIPAGLRQRQNVEVIDLRKERMTERDMRDALSDFVIYRFEKVLDDEGYDLEGHKIESSWSNCHRSLVTDVSREDAFRQVAKLNRNSAGVVQKKKALNPDQQRQLERAMEDLVEGDHQSQIFGFELAQIDDQLIKLDPSLLTTVYRPHSSHRHHSHRHHRSHSRTVYKSDKKQKKKIFKRISLTAYYKRVPKADANIFAMYEDRERRKNTLPRFQQELIEREMNMQRERMFHEEQMRMGGPGRMPGPGHFDGHGPGHGPHPGPHGGGGGGKIPHGVQVINGPNGMKGGKGGKKDKKGRHSDSGSDSSFSDEGSFWSEGSGSRDTGTSTYTSSHSHGHGRRRKSKPYIEGPGPAYFGVGKPHVTRRHSRDAGAAFPPLPPAAPAVPLPDVDRIQQHAYDLGLADGRITERHENIVDDLQRENERLREVREQEAELHQRELLAARREQRRLMAPPRVVQEVPWGGRHAPIARQIGARHVTESEVDRQVEADFTDQFRRMGLRSPSEDEYSEEVNLRLPPSPRRARGRYEPRTFSVEEELLDEDEWRTGRRAGAAVDYMRRRRASSPGVSPVSHSNPFRPRRERREFFDVPS